MVETYQEVLNQVRLCPEFDICQAVVAGGISEAREQLAKEIPFHLVVLDVKLPSTVGGSSEATTESGLDLLPQLSNRDSYPIPGLLILTGNQRYLIRSLFLNEQLSKTFYYSLIREKGTDKDIETYFREAIFAVQQYIDFGIHINADEDRTWPILSPRELDLIRRAGLTDHSFAGVDLRWSHAELKNLGDFDDWTKVLMGHYWLKGSSAETRSFFFKLESVLLSSNSVSSAKQLENVLRHVQIKNILHSSKRSLTVTASASLSDGRPVSISEFLRQPNIIVRQSLSQIANDISDQLAEIGDLSDLPKYQADLLWDYHNLQSYDDYYVKLRGDSRFMPSAFVERLKSVNDYSWRKWKSLQHGDLHLGNIVIDTKGEKARALLIDSGAMGPGPAGKDLAYFEIALVLHLTSSSSSIFELSKQMYGGPASDAEGDDLAKNVLELLGLIRDHALKVTDEKTYKVLLLDQAMIQFGSLCYGSFGNKVRQPLDALNLYTMIAAWVEGVFID